MNKDKKVLYIVSIIIFVLLLVALFADIGSSRIVAACLLLPLAVITCLVIKKRGSLSINKREILLLSTVLSAIYVILLQASGIYFGYYENPYFVSLEIFFQRILPLAVIIVSTEIIRYVILAQKNKLTSVLVFLSCVIAEMLMVSNLVGITSLNKFMDLVGMALFPAISANVYYHYTSKNYGVVPNAVFRLISTLYIYFFPKYTAMPDALSACIKIVFPIIMLALVVALYSKKKKNANRKGARLSAVCMVAATAFIVSVAMLISCQFRFGALVIATESMTGEINKGDMIIYEKYDDQKIEEGQVIVFQQYETKIVHRVVRIERIGGETRYYTKGDANVDLDLGYRTDADIIGLTDAKIAYVGYPTLWLHEFTSK